MQADLEHADLALTPTIKSVDGATIRYEHGISAGENATIFASVFGEEDASVETALSSDHTVSEPLRVAAFRNRAIYQLRLETDVVPVPPECAAEGIFPFTITGTDGGWTVRLCVSDREALSTYRECCRDMGISFRMTELYESSASDDGRYVLTDRQREILSLAYSAGYYDVPRRASQGDLADRLDVSTSAVSQQLRRAVTELLEATLETDPVPVSE